MSFTRKKDIHASFSWSTWTDRSTNSVISDECDGKLRSNNEVLKHEDTASSSQPTICSSSSNGSTISSEKRWKEPALGSFSEPDSEQRSWSTVSRGKCDEASSKFSYKEILLMNDFSKLNINGISPELETTSNINHSTILENINRSETKKNLMNKHSNTSSNNGMIELKEKMEREKRYNNNQPIVNSKHSENQINHEHEDIHEDSSNSLNHSNHMNNKRMNGQSSSRGKKQLKHIKDYTNTKISGPRMNVTIIREAISQAVSQGRLSKSIRRDMRQSLRRGETNAVLESLRRHCHLQPMFGPMEIRYPNDFELRSTNGLMKYVNQLSPLPNSEELARKHITLVELERLIDTWVRNKAEEYELDIQGTSSIYVGGSCHLKVDTRDSDLDVVVLTPLWITKEDYLHDLSYFLQEKLEILNLCIYSEASVPRFTFTYNTIMVDLILARFTQNIVPKYLPIHSDHILSGMDSNSVKSLSGPRVASIILELIPDPTTFRACLRAVRLWAQRRGLYNSQLGFLSGISWTILVAFICQLFPKASPSTLFYQLFHVLSTWKWPTPIALAIPYDAGLGFEQWSPQNNQYDRSHVMPIITPSYPAYNSASHVNISTLNILQNEFIRGKMILDSMFMKGLTSPGSWMNVFDLTEFSVQYDHYLCINYSSMNVHDLMELRRQIEIRIRKLIEALQHTNYVSTVHPFTSTFSMKMKQMKFSTSHHNPQQHRSSNSTHPSSSSSYHVKPQRVPLHSSSNIDISTPLPESHSISTSTSSSNTNSTITLNQINSFSSSELSNSNLLSSSLHEFEHGVYLGLEFSCLSSNETIESIISPVVKYFIATSLNEIDINLHGRHIQIELKDWEDLPESLFIDGKQNAAGQRAKFVLSRAHNLHLLNEYAYVNTM